MRRLAAALLLLPTAIPASAEVLCPRVTSEHNADLTELQRFRQYHKWRDKKDEEKDNYDEEEEDCVQTVDACNCGQGRGRSGGPLVLALLLVPFVVQRRR